MNIILVGFMGCGKTTIARILSKRLNMRFVDTDKLIESQEGLTIREIFDKKGEGYFREIEKRIITSHLRFCDGCVIAVGGGMPCFFDNMDKLKKIGMVVFIDVDFESIKERAGASKRKRPLFEDEDKARELFMNRMKCYRKAHMIVDGKRGKKMVALEIEKILKGKY